MKRLASILLVAAALGSCSKGNTDSPTPPAPSTSSVSLVPSQPIDYISKVEEYDVISGNTPSTRQRAYLKTYTFEYDDHKRLTFTTESNVYGSSGKIPISYHDDAINFGEDLLTLNSQGRVTKHEQTSYEKNKEGVLGKKVELAGKDYVYDSEGHHLSHTGTEYNTSSEWKEGNLVKRTFTYTGKQSDRRPDVVTQEYSSIPNRTFPDLNLMPGRFLGIWDSQPHLWSHIKGIRSANLISSQVIPLYYNDGTPREPMYIRWAYKLDAKGRPIDLEMSVIFQNFYDRGKAFVITYLDK